MATPRDAVIIGGGHNGLVAAALLARAGLKPLVLERADRVGGCAITGEIAPGFRAPTLAHRAALDPRLLRVLDLGRHGLQILRSDARVFVPIGEGRGLTLWDNGDAARQAIAGFSTHDAGRYGAFLASFSAVSRVIRSLASVPAPSIDRPAPRDLLELLRTARAFRALARADAYRLLRWMPMPVGDLVSEWFECEPLRAAIAAGGLIGSPLGPRSAGSAAVLLWLSAGEGHPLAAGWTARGGIGAVSEALASAARAAGAEIRTLADVRRIVVRDGAASGVVLASGEEIEARRVVSGLDPRRTFLSLVDPLHLSPEFADRVRHIRMRGTLAKVNYAVDALPRFQGLSGVESPAALSGCVRLAPDLNALERAFDASKYGELSEEPWIELAIPSLGDGTLAPAGRHVVSAYVQFAPFTLRGSSWDREREKLGDAATRTIARYAPGFAASILARQIVTPADLERTHGLTGGHIFHGELALDQMLIARPLLGWERYRSPIDGLYLCGSGTHPGSGLDGRSGMLAAREILNREL